MLKLDDLTATAILELAKPYRARGIEEPMAYVIKMMTCSHLLRRLQIILTPELLDKHGQTLDDLLRLYISFSKANRNDPGFEIIPGPNSKVKGIITPTGLIE